MSNQAAVANLTAKTAHKGVLAKLIAFSVSLAVVPITSYFVSEKYVWNGNSNYAAITAIVMANVVLVAYIITSILEDRESVQASEQAKKTLTESKKDR